MTFSIVARSADGESWGVAVASKFLAVGSAVPAAVAGVGAIATQADANVAYKGQALSHLDDGATASVALQRLLEDDEGRDARQVGIVDVDGGAASHTGHACLEWAGSITGDGFADPGQHPGRRGGRARHGGGVAQHRRRRAARPSPAGGADRRRRRRGRQPRAAVGRTARRTGGSGVRRPRRHRRRPAGRRPRRSRHRARAAARPQRPLPDRLDRRGEDLPHRGAEAGDRGEGEGARLPRPARVGRHRELRDARRPGRRVARRADPGDPSRHRYRPADPTDPARDPDER